MFNLPSVSPLLTVSVVDHLFHGFEVRARSLVVPHELIKPSLQLIELELRDRFQKFWVASGGLIRMRVLVICPEFLGGLGLTLNNVREDCEI
jgi:hypothetical protein